MMKKLHKTLAVMIMALIAGIIIVPITYILLLQEASYRSAVNDIQVVVTEERENLYFITGYLTTLPPEIGSATTLTNLSVQYNLLYSLPSEIGKLTNLESLSIVENPLEVLPPEIGKLTNLSRLLVVETRITQLPPEIGNLTNLQTLDLRNNQLTSLPSQIGNLSNLSDLQLYGNPFDAPQDVIEQGDWAIFEYYANLNPNGDRD